MQLSSKIVLFLFVFNCSFLFSQKTQKDSIDSYFKQIEGLILRKDLHKEDFLDVDALLAKNKNSQGTEKVKTLLKLSTAHAYKSTEIASSYNDKALQLALDIGYKYGELCAKYNRAYLLFVRGYFDESMSLALVVEETFGNGQYPELSADIQNLKSDIYTERGEYDLALEIGLKLLDEGEKSKNEYVLMRACSSLSHYYLRIENYSKALSYCIRGLHYIIRLRKMLFIFPKIDEIARMSAKLGDTKKALELYTFYLDVEKKIAPPGNYIQSVVYMNIADIYASNKEYEKAQNYLSKALDIIYLNDYRFRTPRALKLQAELFLKTKDTTNAILNYKKSIEAAENINAFDVVKSNSAILANLYEETNQLFKAYEYTTLHKAISDSLFTNEKDQKIIILEAKRKIKEVTQSKGILELENEAHKAKYGTIIVILAFLLIISALTIYAYSKVETKNKLLYRRTIELAEVQFEMEKRLEEFKKKKATDLADTKEISFSKPNYGIDEDVKDIILSKLKKLESENFFIDTNCSLRNLAQQLKTNPKYLSQVINQEKKSNFSYYINELRINYLLSRLLKEKDFRESKLSYIAVSVGFNNLNTFNTAFKKRQGILPSYFIRELIHDQNKGYKEVIT